MFTLATDTISHFPTMQSYNPNNQHNALLKLTDRVIKLLVLLCNAMGVKINGIT